MLAEGGEEWIVGTAVVKKNDEKCGMRGIRNGSSPSKAPDVLQRPRQFVKRTPLSIFGRFESDERFASSIISKEVQA